MKKNLVQDIVPPSKKSIRNIEIPSRRTRVESPAAERPRADVAEFSAKAPAISASGRDGKENFPRPAFDYSASLLPTPESPVESLYKYEYDQPKKPSRKILYTTAVIFILALAFGISALFRSAKITIAPKSQSIHLSSNFTANKDDTSGLAFQIVSVSKDAQKTVVSNGQVQVQKKASGTVVIFNNSSPKRGRMSLAR